jgi:hypothetical protein
MNAEEISKKHDVHCPLHNPQVFSESGDFSATTDTEQFRMNAGKSLIPTTFGIHSTWSGGFGADFLDKNDDLLIAHKGVGEFQPFSDSPFHIPYDEFARRREVLLSRIPEGSTIICTIVRRSGFLIPETFTLRSDSNHVICYASSKPLRSRGSYFSVYSDRDHSYLGKIRSNQWGSEYFFQDADDRSSPALRVDYESRLTTNSEDLGPCRRMTATLLPHNCKSFDIFSDSTFTSLRLSSLEPARTPQGYTLDFETPEKIIPSVKNFVLVNVTGHKVLSMYKVGKDEYELKILGGYMSLLHAFVIGVTSIDKKLCTQ